MTTKLIPNEEYCQYYKTRLPDTLLYSDEIYITEAAYNVVLNLDDDCQLDDLEFEYQLSNGAITALNNFRNSAYKRYNIDGDFKAALTELQMLINDWLLKLNLEEIIIND